LQIVALQLINSYMDNGHIFVRITGKSYMLRDRLKQKIVW